MPDHFPSLAALDQTLWLCEPAALQLSIARVMRAPCPTPRQVVKERQRRLEYAKDAPARAVASTLTDRQIGEAFEADQQVADGRAVRGVKGRVGVIAVHGPIEQRYSSELAKCGGTSCDEIGVALNALLADKTVDAIVMHIDSPGGSSHGVLELSQKLYDAREQKAIYTSVDSMMASAAAWIGTAATYVAITPGGDAGSIGVYAVHTDKSKALELEGVRVTLVKAARFKAELAPFAPLEEGAKAHLQELVDDTYSKFVSAVARNRNTSRDDVRKNYGEGRIMTAEQSVKVGLCDGIRTFEQLMAKLTGGSGDSTARKASEEAALRRQMDEQEVRRLRFEHERQKAAHALPGIKPLPGGRNP